VNLVFAPQTLGCELEKNGAVGKLKTPLKTAPYERNPLACKEGLSVNQWVEKVLKNEMAAHSRLSSE